MVEMVCSENGMKMMIQWLSSHEMNADERKIVANVPIHTILHTFININTQYSEYIHLIHNTINQLC